MEISSWGGHITISELSMHGENNVISHVWLPKRKLFIKNTPNGATWNSERMDTCGGVEQNKDFKLGKETSTMWKILFYCIKGKTSLLPMEIILLILQELENFKILVKLAKRKRDEEGRSSQISLVSPPTSTHRIWINKVHHNKLTFHLMVEINNYVIFEGLVTLMLPCLSWQQ